VSERASTPGGGLWGCPHCGRRFKRPNQAHSCQARNVDDHFHGRSPELRGLFDALRAKLERSGPLRVDAVKSTINLISTHHFGGIAVRRDHLRVGFILDHAIDAGRITRVERVGPRRFSHHIVLRSPADLDAEVLAWLAESQALQADG